MNNEIERIIEQSEPSGEHIYPENKDIFLFARRAKTAVKDDGSVDVDLEEIAKRYYDRWKKSLVDNNGDCWSFDEVFAHFIYCWEKIKSAEGEWMNKVIQAASERVLPEVAKKYTDKCVRHLVAVCYELQRMQGNKAFWLSSYDAGKIMGRSQNRGFMILKLLVIDGVLRVAKKGNAHQATRYKVDEICLEE